MGVGWQRPHCRRRGWGGGIPTTNRFEKILQRSAALVNSCLRGARGNWPHPAQRCRGRGCGRACGGWGWGCWSRRGRCGWWGTPECAAPGTAARGGERRGGVAPSIARQRRGCPSMRVLRWEHSRDIEAGDPRDPVSQRGSRTGCVNRRHGKIFIRKGWVEREYGEATNEQENVVGVTFGATGSGTPPTPFRGPGSCPCRHS